MTETQAPAVNGADTPVQSRNAYLPVPPEGWEYMVTLVGPKGARIIASATDWPAGAVEHPAPGITVEVKAATVNKTFDVPTLKDAVRAAVDAAKAIDAIAEHEQRAKAATQKLLDTIGGNVTPEENGLEEFGTAAAAADTSPDN